MLGADAPTQWRVQLACELLREADRRIAEVASTVQFAATQRFDPLSVVA